MFGPDKCGSDSKLHFIFRHKNPITGVMEEKHCNKVISGGELEGTLDRKLHWYPKFYNHVILLQGLKTVGTFIEL